jgi:hypothetical protein
LSLLNAHYDEQCFLPNHAYDAGSGHCVVTILRPGKSSDGKEVRAHLRRLVRRIRLHWPNTVITARGDGHYGRRQAMAWCEENGIRYVFGLSKNPTLDAQVYAKADNMRTRRTVAKLDLVRNYTETLYAAKSWPNPGRGVARLAAISKGFDTRYVVINIIQCGSQWLYDSLYCARGQAENLIKRHKSQLAARQILLRCVMTARLFELHPRWRVVARVRFAPYLPINPGVQKPPGEVRAQQEMVEAKTGIPAPSVAHVVPERVDPARRVHRPERIGPALRGQASKRLARLRLHERILLSGH